VQRRWVPFAFYVVAIYASLPFGPIVGRTLVRTGLGAWLFGPGFAVLGGVSAALIVRGLIRRAAPKRAYALLVLASAGYGLALLWLRAQHLERVHLPEYGLAAWLAWWAFGSRFSEWRGYVMGAAAAALAGYGDELLQRVVPGRYYDLRDVAANALSAVLGMLVLAAIRAGREVTSADGSPGTAR
jgi:hypothetical protein